MHPNMDNVDNVDSVDSVDNIAMHQLVTEAAAGSRVLRYSSAAT